MPSYTQVAESYIANLLVSIQRPLQQSVKQAILGGDEDLLRLLYELPNSPGLKSLIGQQVSVWIDECKLEIVILQFLEGFAVDEEKLKNWILATSLRAQNVPECDGEARFDFIPSRVLMSAALQLDLAQVQGVEVNFGKIRRDDPMLWHHPMLADESSSSREWFMKGRQTPVPGAVRAGARAASTFNPVIIEGHVDLRSRHDLLEVIPRHDTTPSTSIRTASLITMQRHPMSKYPRENVAPKRRNTRVKSKEFVDDSSEEVRDEGNREEETEQRGRSSMRMDKGKGKQKDISEEGRELGRKMSVKAEEMDVDLEMDELAEDQSSPSPPKRMPMKSSMKRGREMSREVNEGNLEACERCVKRGMACIYGGHVACEACRAHKQKCTGVRADWRKKKTMAATKEEKKRGIKPVTAIMPAAMPALGEAHIGEASSNTTLRRSTRARSSSRPPEAPKVSSTPHRGATPKPQVAPKRGTTPKPTGKTKTMPRSKAKSSTSSRSRSKSRKADEDEEMSDGGETGRGRPGGTAVAELGQVPSRYVYLLNRDGKEVTGGVRVDNGERVIGGESDSGVMEDLRRENRGLMMEMAEMREEMRKLKETVVGLQMSQSVLISHHNAHTALLERHRRTLTTITSQPPTPSDRGTPSEDDAMYRLSMPPSHFSVSPQPSNSATHVPIPPCPSPYFPTDPLVLVTPKTSKMFDECIHPSMLELNKLNISSSPSYVHRVHLAPDIVMADDVPVAGPSCGTFAGVQDVMSSGVVDRMGAVGVMSEKVGSSTAGASQMVKEEDKRPRIPMPRIIRSPASQTEASEVDRGESSAMAIDGAEDELDGDQGEPGGFWNTMI